MIYNLKGHNIHLDEVAGIDKSSEPIISINYKNKPMHSVEMLYDLPRILD